MKITKKLENMLVKASKKLEEAQDSRDEVINYLEEHYGIDTHEYSELLEDNDIWCYGINNDKVRELIEKS